MSMATEDGETGSSRTRWDVGLKGLDSVNSSNFDLEVQKYGFDTSLVPLEQIKNEKSGEAAWPRGHRSDLAFPIRQLLRSQSANDHAILLVSDGAHNSGSVESLLTISGEAMASDVPIYTVTLGSTKDSRNLSVTARSPRMIVFPKNPVALRVRVGQSGLDGESVVLTLFEGDRQLQSQTVRLDGSTQKEVQFLLDKPSESKLARYRIAASELQGEATTGDNQTMVLVQRLDAPIGVLLLEGKPYWDSKFLARNLSADPAVELTSLVRLNEKRFLRKKYPRLEIPNSGTTSNTEPKIKENENNASTDNATSDWVIQENAGSPLDSMETLDAYRVVVLGRDAETYLSEKTLVNLKEWVSKRGGCLLCSRGSPTDRTVGKLSEMLPVQWERSKESRFRTKVSQYGFDSAVFDPLLEDGSDPLLMMPSLSTSSAPVARPGLPQVLLQSVMDGTGTAIPVVVYQPYGNGQSIVVEGSGMWRWAFLPPSHAEKDKIYPTLWQSMIQWIVSQQDLVPGQEVAIRSDRATFLTGDRVTATAIVKLDSRHRNEQGKPDLEVLLQGSEMEIPKRFSLIPLGADRDLFRIDFGTLDVGFYSAKVVFGEKDEVVAETALEIRDPWFERLEVNARPDIMRRLAKNSGGEVIEIDKIQEVVDRFQKRVEDRNPPQFIRTSLWDRPWVMILVLSAWFTSWIVRRRNGLV